MGASKTSRMFVCAMLLFATAGGTHAGIIRGDFSGIVQAGGPPFAGPRGSSYNAHYTYDSTAVPVSLPGVFGGSGSGYRGISFVIDGTTLHSVVIGISNGQLGFDILWVLSGLEGVPAMQLAGPAGLWNSESLGVLDLVVFGDFSETDRNRVFADISGTITASITSWSQRLATASVSEPNTLAILGLGMAGVAFLRRFRASHSKSARVRKS